jgi:hypothetical protein
MKSSRMSTEATSTTATTTTTATGPATRKKRKIQNEESANTSTNAVEEIANQFGTSFEPENTNLLVEEPNYLFPIGTGIAGMDQIPLVDPLMMQDQQQLPIEREQPLPLNSKKPNPTPAFLQKLYSMLQDASIPDITWSVDGDSFHITNPDSLSKKVLPFYFKHNNFASFIRQLNMYGFRKCNGIGNGTLVSNALQVDDLSFKHDHFIRGRPDLLSLITRKKTNVVAAVESDKKVDLSAIVAEIQQIKMQQRSISQDLVAIQAQNAAVWSQNSSLQTQYNQQKDTIERILSFLASVFSKKKMDNSTLSSTAMFGALDQNLLLAPSTGMLYEPESPLKSRVLIAVIFTLFSLFSAFTHSL